MKTIIIHHNADLDGWLSGTIAAYAEKRINPSNSVEMVGWNYGDPMRIDDLLTEEVDRVVVTDLTLPRTIMQELWAQLGTGLVWIDHHEQAIRECDDLSFSACPGLRDSSHCATTLAYFLYLKDELGPWAEQEAVRLTEIADLFEEGSPEFELSQFLSSGLMLNPKINAEKVVAQMLGGGRSQFNLLGVMNDGKIARMAIWDEVKKVTPCIFRLKDDTSILAYNYYDNRIPAHVVETMPVRPKTQAVAMFRIESNRVRVSVRALDKECDVRPIVALYGGGGHKGAGGFIMTFEQFRAALTQF